MSKSWKQLSVWLQEIVHAAFSAGEAFLSSLVSESVIYSQDTVTYF